MTSGPDAASGSDARMEQWRAARSGRLAALPWLHTDTSGPRAVRYMKDEMIVAAEHEQVARDALAASGASAGQITAQPALLGYVLLTAPGADIAAATTQLRAQAGDSAGGPHHVFASSPFEMGGPFGPPASADSYALASGPAPDASVRVAVVDTGVWRDSPLPDSWYQAGAADYDNTLDAESDTGHANFITGVIMAGTANARVQIIKVLDANGICSELTLATALTALTDVDIINLSLGGFSTNDQPPLLLAAALGQLLSNCDRAVVAAAGNEGSDGPPYWPAGFAGTDEVFASQVVSVAAHDGTQLCDWSNRGQWVDLAAPGSGIVSTYVTLDGFASGFASWSGTSFAAPYIVAAIASRHAPGGTIAAAVENVKKEAATSNYGGYPGLA